MLTKRAKDIKPSLTLAITAKAAALKAEGADIVSFTAGEPDFDTPDFVVAAAKAALDSGKTKYTASSGIVELRKAICQKLKVDNSLDYSPNQIVVSNGAKHSLYNAMLALIEQGDEVLVLEPYWLTYPELISLCGGTAVYIAGDSSFKVSPSVLEKSITKKTKVIIFNNPSNPSGVVYTEGEVKALCKVLEKSGIYIISDEIYEELVYDGLTLFSPAQYSEKLKEKTIVVNGLSKAYSMTGWRVGYTASNIELANAMDSIQSHTTSNANSIAQWAATEALTNSANKKFLEDNRKLFEQRRDLIISLIEKIDCLSVVKPQGAFYIMVSIEKLVGKTLHGKKIVSAADIASLLVEKVGVVTIPCESFGANNYLRLSYALSEAQIKKGIEKLARFFD